MQNWMKACAVAFIATSATWWIFSPQATPALEAAPQIIVTSDPIPEPAQIQRIDVAAGGSRAARDLFAYSEAPLPPPPSRQTVVPDAAPSQVAVEVVAPPPVEKPQPQFTWRYIGRFGHDPDPIAAFVRDGQVITVRAGERVGEFRVKSIGAESVEVEADGEVVRVRL